MTSALTAARNPAVAPSVTVRRRVRPRPTVDLSRLTRYRGGTYSHTVERILFTDGTSAHTDLIRLNPGVQAYSLDFAATAPLHPSGYRVENFAAVPNLRARAHEVEVDWILRNSYPTLRVAELSRRVRAAGYVLGAAHISEHEAIAATQAAIWRLTNGLELDTRALNEPIRTVRSADGVTFEFDGEPELGGYSVEVLGGTAAGNPVTVTLHKSVDGRDWQQVAAAQVTVTEAGNHRITLGVGATLSTQRYGRAGSGHRYYRLTAEGPDGAPVPSTTVGAVSFWLHGSGHYRNADRIVHLYNYLLEGARRARARSTAPALGAARAEVDDDRGLVGPFRLGATSPAALVAEAADLVTADGDPITGTVDVGAAFYLRPDARSRNIRSATVTMTVPGAADGYGGPVLTGVARDEASQHLTPVALVVPSSWVVDFDITW